MKMDLYNAEKYAKMCETPFVQKYWSGPEWGDDIYVPDGGALTVGFDWLRVSEYFRQGQRIVKFAMMQEPKMIHIEPDRLPDIVQVKSGEYIIVTIQNPIWLPKIEQILKIIDEHGKFDIPKVLRELGRESSEGEMWYYFRTFDFWRQKFLAYYMKHVQHLYWMEGNKGWYTLEQCKKMVAEGSQQ